MVDISGLNRLELKELLRKIKLLNSLIKNLGRKKGISEYNIIGNGENLYKVEYCDYMDKNLSYIEQSSIDLFEKLFGLKLLKDDITFIVNKNLVGGVRIFLNDNMYDFSYQRFEKMLK